MANTTATTALDEGMAVLFRVRVLHNFDPDPNNVNDDGTPIEVQIRKGEILNVISQDEGWWGAIKQDGSRGLFPYNYVTKIEDEPTEGEGQEGQAAKPAPKAGRAAPPSHPNPNAGPHGAANGAKPPMKLIPIQKPQINHNDVKLDMKSGDAKAASPRGQVVAVKNTGSGGKRGSVKAEGGVKQGPSVSVQITCKTRFGMWGSNMGEMSKWTMVLCGICAIIWAISDINLENHYPGGGILTPMIGVYSLVLAVGIHYYEKYVGNSRNGSGCPVRMFLYWIFGGFFFLSQTTMVVGAFMFVTGCVQGIAAVLGEEYNAPPEAVRAQHEREENGDRNAGYCCCIRVCLNCCEDTKEYFVMKKEQNKLGVLIFIVLYVISNIIIFVVVVAAWFDANAKLVRNDGECRACRADTQRTNPGPCFYPQAQKNLLENNDPTRVTCDPETALSAAGPFAKGFGNLLDFNCSIVLVPVLRTILRWLYNQSTSGETCGALFLRGLLSLMPIDKNLAFHKLVAKVIVFAACGHVLFHFANYANAPHATFAKFGLWPWISGGIIMLMMLFIYSSVPDNTKRGQFEIFWYSHHCFAVFFIMLILHGAGGIGPHFWMWFIGPGTLYVIERLLRVYRASQRVVVLSVTIMKPDVFSMEFAKEGVLEGEYKEGQYLFVNCPTISSIQWHPFTISSAPHEATVTLHIRTCGKDSWTLQLQQYLAQMGGIGKTWFSLDRQGPTGKVAGKVLGPNGLPMLQIDGPHSAPTQHMPEYKTGMIIGAGIGVTPVASTMKEIVWKRWKFSLGDGPLQNAYFYWVCAHRDVDAFRWLIRMIMDCQNEVVHMRHSAEASMASKVFEVHIFVTSAPKDPKKPSQDVADDDIGFWGVPYAESKVAIEKVRADFTALDLYTDMLCPPPQHKQMGDIHIWNGRPNWSARFDEVAKAHAGEVGVAFCGNPMIGSDLAKMCHKFSHGRPDGIFKLHKENF